VLAPRHRLNTREVLEVAKKGRRASTGDLMVKYLPRSAGPARLAFLVSAKTVRRAVDRHLLKRRAVGAVTKEALASLTELDICVYLPPQALAWPAHQWLLAITNLLNFFKSK
jgi:ribonuclease P protein component